jgi:molybdopterin converting factor small subunit
MTRCIVEMYGLPHEITELREVEFELKDRAGLGDVIAALRREIPALDGHVIRVGEDRLTEYYAFNINGRFYFDDRELQVHEGDHIVLLTLATGG